VPKLVKLTFAKGLIVRKGGKPYANESNTVYVVAEKPYDAFSEFDQVLSYEVLGDAIVLDGK
jgi:hypothetical protein